MPSDFGKMLGCGLLSLEFVATGGNIRNVSLITARTARAYMSVTRTIVGCKSYVLYFMSLMSSKVGALSIPQCSKTSARNRFATSGWRARKYVTKVRSAEVCEYDSDEYTASYRCAGD